MKKWNNALAMVKSRLLFGSGAVWLAVVLALAAQDQPGLPTGARVAAPAPDFEMTSLTGHKITLADIKQPAVVVSFWLRSDRPSQRQVPILTALRSEFGTNRVAMVGVLIEPPEATNGPVPAVDFPILRYNAETVEGFGGLTAVPTTIVIDHNRNIISKYVGFAGTNVLKPDIEAILKAHEKAAGQ